MTSNTNENTDSTLTEKTKAALLNITEKLNDLDTANEALQNLKMQAQNAGVHLHTGQAPQVPDSPSCDFCGNEFTGTLACSRCQCVYYCSKECQKRHWKAPNGHKVNCEKMNYICIEKAQSFMSAYEAYKDAKETNVDSMVEHQMLISALEGGLDENGPYKQALDLGLNTALEYLMDDEIKNAEQRFKTGFITSFVQWILCTLFRSGRTIPGHVFSGIDGYRVKQYVHNSTDAFEKWFTASLKIIEIFQTQGMNAARKRDLTTFWKIQQCARDIACGWSFVFTNKKAAKAILLGRSKEVDDAARNRAKWIIAQMKRIIPQFPSDTNSPDNSAVEGQTNMFTALIELRMEEFQIDVGNYLELLGLKGVRKTMYDNMAIPLAEGTIQKGKSLDTVESNQVLKQYAMSGKMRVRKTAYVSDSSMTSKQGKKKKGKK